MRRTRRRRLLDRRLAMSPPDRLLLPPVARMAATPSQRAAHSAATRCLRTACHSPPLPPEPLAPPCGERHCDTIADCALPGSPVDRSTDVSAACALCALPLAVRCELLKLAVTSAADGLALPLLELLLPLDPRRSAMLAMPPESRGRSRYPGGAGSGRGVRGDGRGDGRGERPKNRPPFLASRLHTGSHKGSPGFGQAAEQHRHFVH